MAFNQPFGTLAAVWKRLFYVRAGLLRLVHGVQSLRRKLVQRPYHEVGLVECSGGFRDEMVGTDDAFYAGGPAGPVSSHAAAARPRFRYDANHRAGPSAWFGCQGFSTIFGAAAVPSWIWRKARAPSASVRDSTQSSEPRAPL